MPSLSDEENYQIVVDLRIHNRASYSLPMSCSTDKARNLVTLTTVRRQTFHQSKVTALNPFSLKPISNTAKAEEGEVGRGIKLTPTISINKVSIHRSIMGEGAC